MAYSHYERLSALDATFLEVEDHNAHMHLETRAVYPLVPLNRNQALGIALFSYNGMLFWGFNADWDAVPDLHDLVDATRKEFELLRAAAAHAPRARSRRGGEAAPSQPARRRRRAS
jgi:hypothetical protein